MAWGDGGKKLFLTDSDHLLFLDWLDGACKRHGWRIHAWVLMGNHFHLLLETPEPNLVSGMKWLLGGFSQAWNRRYKRTGHVFQGRYKSIPVSGERASDPYHFGIVADYIHLVRWGQTNNHEGAGGNLRGGRVLDYLDKPKRSMCSLFLNLMEWGGLKLDRFNDSTERLPGV